MVKNSVGHKKRPKVTLPTLNLGLNLADPVRQDAAVTAKYCCLIFWFFR